MPFYLMVSLSNFLFLRDKSEVVKICSFKMKSQLLMQVHGQIRLYFNYFFLRTRLHVLEILE